MSGKNWCSNGGNRAFSLFAFFESVLILWVESCLEGGEVERGEEGAAVSFLHWFSALLSGLGYAEGRRRRGGAVVFFD